MKVTIENKLSQNFLNDYFIDLLNSCIEATDKDDLHKKIKSLFNDDDTTICTYFKFGYTQNYMWVRERNHKNNLFIVEF